MWYSVLALAVLVGDSQAGRFWHISDVHYDPLLSSEKRSCVISVDTIPKWGSQYCDSNLQLVQSAFDAMKRIESNPDFIIWTGDSALHYWSPRGTNGTEEEIVDILTILSEMLADAFPGVPVISSLGNHDYVPDNQLPAEVNEIYTNISAVWNKLGWFDGEIGERESFRKYGYYTIRLPSGLVATALNTNFYYLGNKVYEDLPDDPGNQFAMLEQVLKDARANSTKVFISAHIPFGVGATGSYIHMYEKYNKRFVNIVRDYHDVIIASFFGHEHNSAIKLVFDSDETTVVSAAFLAPSITPWRYIIPDQVESPYHNPGLRLFDYEGGLIKDYSQYYFDLQEANQGKDISWSHLYKFTETYGVDNASTSSMYQVAKAVRRGDKLSEYLQSYYCKKDVVPCDERCRAGMSCAIFEVTQVGAAKCVEDIPDNSNNKLQPQTLLVIVLSFLVMYQVTY